MPVRVVTDSTADLPAHLVEELRITVVPLTVMFGDETYRDGVDLSTEQFFERLTQSDALPTTSQPSVGVFQEAYERLASETKEIVSIHITSKASGTFDAALRAREAISDGPRIELVDSLSASMGVGFIVLAAARAAKAGASLDAVASLARSMVPRVHPYVVLDTLEFLRRGGRIGRAAAFLGGMLNVKPILAIRDGVVHPITRVRTRKKAVDRMLDLAMGHPDIAEVAVLHGTTPDDAEELARRVSERQAGIPVYVGFIGPVIGVHGGPGIIGIVVVGGEREAG